MIRFSGANHPGEYRHEPHEVLGPPPKGKLAKLKYYYDKYKLRHIAPIALLIIYSIVGACLFYMVEHEHEQELLKYVLELYLNNPVSFLEKNVRFWMSCEIVL